MPASLRPALPRTGTWMVAALVLAPLAICAAAFLTFLLFRHQQSALAAHYAAIGLIRLPEASGLHEPSFLHGVVGGRDMLARNPSAWSDDIVMRSFFLVPMVFVIAGAFVYSLRSGSLRYALATPVALLVLLYMQADFVRMAVSGWEIVLDPQADALLLDGRPVAKLSDVARFAGWAAHRRKGGDDWLLAAVLADGRTVELQGPAARKDVLTVAEPLDAMLEATRPVPAAQLDCSTGRCIAVMPAPNTVRDAVGQALGPARR